MGIDLTAVGATYTSKGMIFVVLSFKANEKWDEVVAKVLVLQDHSNYIKFIPPGTVMEIESWTSVWNEALQIASLPEHGKVSP